MEILLQDESDFAGDIIAKPSTARSLLVSAPKHIIIPYQEPAIIPPCEARKLNTAFTGNLDKDKMNELIRNGDNNGIRVKPVHILTGTIKPKEKHVAEKAPAIKKVAATRPAKTATKTPKKK